MRIRLRAFGYTILSITIDGTQQPQTGITGGTNLYTERDMNPPTNEEPWYEERSFGFRPHSDRMLLVREALRGNPHKA